MNLLLSNDDGVFSAGMLALARELAPHHNIRIVAPDTQRSGAGHGVTFVTPVRVKKVTLPDLPDVPAYEASGTPADCVRLGCTGLDFDVDMVISGINHGANLGSDVLYSGTVGAAMEGALLGLPAIATSSYNHFTIDFSAAARATLLAIEYVRKHPLPKGMILNLNAPELPISEIKGIKFAGLCLQTYDAKYAKFDDPFGMTYYWMPIEKSSTAFEQCDKNYDESWVREGYVTLTPIHYDITNYAYLKTMRPEDFDFNAFKEGKGNGHD
ncbi:5'/3'-nucleotidase SurE [Eubacteriales bacterium OttesenSCG-928-K08]|nr:5'/3'-nucleotidase SurE [Eubacteriales bacterium OttesenSCG-928-K08]